MTRRIAILPAIALMTSGAIAQTPPTADEKLRAMLTSRGMDRAQEMAIDQLFSIAPDGRLTGEMAETVDLRAEASDRMAVLASILRHDLDGDGTVSAAELDRIRTVVSNRERAAFEKRILDADTDGDGAVSPGEIAVWVEDAFSRQQVHRRDRFLAVDFMAFDADGDGIVEVADILATIERVAAEDPETARPSSQATTTSQVQDALQVSCDLPRPSEGALPVHVGAYEGTAASTVAVNGLDTATGFATLEIEEGDDPLYILLSVFDPTVVRVTGATERVERLVGNGENGLGVVGLPEEAVDLTSLPPCKLRPLYKDFESVRGIRTTAVLSARLDRPVTMLGTYSLGRMALPSGATDERGNTARSGGGLIIEKGGRRFRMTEDGLSETDPVDTQDALDAWVDRVYPGGIESVMPEDVMSNGTVEAYDVLPAQAGLAQLVRSGHLSVLSGPRSVMTDRGFSIDRPIPRFPPGLHGSRSVEFVLRRGVPMPAGDPGHSMILIEETGECIGTRCLRDR